MLLSLLCEKDDASCDSHLGRDRSGSSNGALLSAICRIRSRAKEEGLPRLFGAVGSISSSASSGCVGSTLSARGLDFRGRALAVADGTGARSAESAVAKHADRWGDKDE